MTLDERNWQRRREMGLARALGQDEHAAINARYPGLTRQHCFICEGETGRCSEDEILGEDGEGPYCEECWALQEVEA